MCHVGIKLFKEGVEYEHFEKREVKKERQRILP